MLHFITDISSLYYSYIPKLIAPLMTTYKIYSTVNTEEEEEAEQEEEDSLLFHNEEQSIQIHNQEETPRLSKRPNLRIITDIDDEVVRENFKRAISKEQKKYDSVNYFRSYLKYFYSCEKSEDEIKEILKVIKSIRKSVKNDFKLYSSICKQRIQHTLKYDEHFYKKTSNARIVKLYHTNYFGKKAVIKVYLYYPNSFLKNRIESQFENEVIFSIYAKTINEKCNFISPEIYSFGYIPVLDEDGNKMECLFIIMEFMEGIELKHVEFTPEVCTKVYEIKKSLSCELLSHNDLHSRNILVDSSNNLIVLDYGESSYTI